MSREQLWAALDLARSLQGSIDAHQNNPHQDYLRSAAEKSKRLVEMLAELSNGKPDPGVPDDDPLLDVEPRLHEENFALPPMEVMEVLAISDQPAFESLMASMGLKVVGVDDFDPLRRQVQGESVVSIASELTEDVNTYIDVSPHILPYKKMAEDYGYIVSFC